MLGAAGVHCFIDTSLSPHSETRRTSHQLPKTPYYNAMTVLAVAIARTSMPHVCCFRIVDVVLAPTFINLIKTYP